MTGPFVVGIDLSTRAIDLVAVDENETLAEWTHIPLWGSDAWERIRTIRRELHRYPWHDAYLVAIERPFSQSRNDSVRLAEGAVLASIPTDLECWEVAPQTWKAALGFKGKGKPGWSDFPAIPPEAGAWPQDPIDAYGVALYARDTNAAGIAAALNPPTGRNQAA